VLAAFVPIWLLTALGALTGRFRVLGDGAERVLGGFVFRVAMPAALFTALARTKLNFSAPALGAFALSTIVAMAAGFALSRWGLRRKPGESTIAAMASGYVNSANLGIPVVLDVLGNASFLTEVLLFQVLIVTPAILIALDHASGRQWSVKRLATLPLRNPVIIGLVLGALCSVIGWSPPDLIFAPLKTLGAAAVPTALIALGISLTVRDGRLDGETGEVWTLSALKLLLQPLIALGAGLALGLGHDTLLVVVVCAALPTAQNTFIFAQEHGQAESVARRTVIVSTALSMATLAGIAWLLS
jgi:predicted permease